MKKLVIFAMLVIAGLVMSSCCNDYDCLIEKYSKTDDPVELAEIADKMMKLEQEGKEMTKEQKKAFRKATKAKAKKAKDDAKGMMDDFDF